MTQKRRLKKVAHYASPRERTWWHRAARGRLCDCPNFPLQKIKNGPIWGWLGIPWGTMGNCVGSRYERFSDQTRPKCGQGT